MLEAIVLGIIQGATEFIPVSSSGHLTLVPALLGWERPDTILILFAHFGTLIALIAYFRKELQRYLSTLRKVILRKGLAKEGKADLRVMRLILLASIPAGTIGLLINDYIEFVYSDGILGNLTIFSTIIAMATLGAIFIFSDKLFRQKKITIEKLKSMLGFFIGLSQIFAFIRGISRSGITILAGQAAGLSRVEAAKFSFLAGIPLLIATSILGVFELLSLEQGKLAEMLPSAIAIFMSSLLSGFFAIKYLLGYLRSNSLAVFGWYRIILALFAALILFT